MQFLNTITKKAVILLWFLPVILCAQPKSNSPYSRFGFGDINDNNFITTQTMGGLGSSYYSGYDINVVNPASLAYLRAAAFDVGLTAKNSSFTESNGNKASLWSGNLAYLSLAFPLQNVINDVLDRKQRNYSLGMGFTLKPYSTVGYNINSSILVDDVGEVLRNYQGSGGTYDFTWSSAFRYKNFSAGVNLGYLFGQTTTQRIIRLEELAFAETTLLEDNYVYSGFLWRAGFLYTLDLDKVKEGEEKSFKDRRITFGLHANSKSGLTTDHRIFEGSAVFALNGSSLRDTLSLAEDLNVKSHLPSELGLGMTYYSGEKLALGVNYTSTKWSQANNRLVNGILNDTYKLSFGGYIRPNYKSVGSYLARVYYRFGAYYNKIPTEIPANNGVGIDDMGLTFGFGLPFFYQRKISHANIGFSLGLKGRNTIIEERYFRVSFSFTFNDDEWFIKRKYN